MTGKQQLPVPIRNTPVRRSCWFPRWNSQEQSTHKNTMLAKETPVYSQFLSNRSHIHMPDISLGKHERKVKRTTLFSARVAEKRTNAKKLTCNSLTIIKHRSLSNPFRPKVPKVFWISEKRRLLVTSWWVFISYQVFSWSMWHVILKQKQNKLKSQKQLRIHPEGMWDATGLGALDRKNNGFMICALITSASRHPRHLTVNVHWARKAKFS